MIVKYQLVGGSSYATLFDESVGAQLLESFTPDFNVTVQNDKLAGSNAEYRTAVGNINVNQPLKFEQQYDSVSLALASIRTFGATLLGAKFHLQVIQDGEVQYYPNCVISNYKPMWKGVSCTHAFKIVSDTVTGSAP